MIVYVESNFILELALLQEESKSCSSIVGLAKSGRCSLVLPAFCIAEPYETLIRRAKRRRELLEKLTSEIKQLARSEPYKGSEEALRTVTGLLVRSGEEERSRLGWAIDTILSMASIIPLSSEIFRAATTAELDLGLSPQDAIVYASVLQHLQKDANGGPSCFLNKNSKDFCDPDIMAALGSLGCTLLPKFNHGVNYIESCLQGN
jgi:predicted nucleic acid-binding protein